MAVNDGHDRSAYVSPGVKSSHSGVSILGSIRAGQGQFTLVISLQFQSVSLLLSPAD